MGTNVAAKVVTPRNLPAAGAKVALGVAGSQIMIKNGDIEDHSTYCARETTDDTGRFHFPAQDKDFQLVITHPVGLRSCQVDAGLGADQDHSPGTVGQGRRNLSSRKAARRERHAQLDVARVHSYGPDVPNIFTQHEATTGPTGRFVFERVIPGNGRIGRSILLMVDDGATEVTSSCMIPADFPRAKPSTSISAAPAGPSSASYGPPEGFKEKVRWNFALVTSTRRHASPAAGRLLHGHR